MRSAVGFKLMPVNVTLRSTLCRVLQGKGGVPLTELKEECRVHCTRSPGDTCARVFCVASNASTSNERAVTPWVRSRSLQLISLKMIAVELLRNCPAYAHEHSKLLRYGLWVPGELPATCFIDEVHLLVCTFNAGARQVALELRDASVGAGAGAKPRTSLTGWQRSSNTSATRASTKQGAHAFTVDAADLGKDSDPPWVHRAAPPSMMVKGRSAISLRFSATRAVSFFGSRATSFSSAADLQISATKPTHCLLYLNEKVFVDDDGATGRTVLAALRSGVQLVLVQEMDPARGACAFRRFYEIVPPALLQLKIFQTIASPLYSHQILRDTCLRQIASAMGAERQLRRGLGLAGHWAWRERLSHYIAGRVHQMGELSDRMGARATLSSKSSMSSPHSPRSAPPPQAQVKFFPRLGPQQQGQPKQPATLTTSTTSGGTELPARTAQP